MKKRVHKLTVTDIAPFKILGISSHENDYRLSWAINQKIKVNFQKGASLVYHRKNNEDLEFSVFKSSKEALPAKMNLISNRCPDGFLLNRIRNIDFILQIFGDINQNEVSEIINKLRGIDLVSAVFELPAQKLREYRHLPPE